VDKHNCICGKYSGGKWVGPQPARFPAQLASQPAPPALEQKIDQLLAAIPAAQHQPTMSVPQPPAQPSTDTTPEWAKQLLAEQKNITDQLHHHNNQLQQASELFSVMDDKFTTMSNEIDTFKRQSTHRMSQLEKHFKMLPEGTNLETTLLNSKVASLEKSISHVLAHLHDRAAAPRQPPIRKGRRGKTGSPSAPSTLTHSKDNNEEDVDADEVVGLLSEAGSPLETASSATPSTGASAAPERKGAKASGK